MTAAYPGSVPSPFDRHGPIKVEERGTIIPSFYVRHERDGEGIVVKQKGVPLIPSFTVAEMPPERRWAVRADGNLMEQNDFEAKLEAVYNEANRAYSHDGKTSPPGNPKRDFFPRIERYVAVQVDLRDPRRFIPIGYVAHPGKEQKVPERYYESSGEPVEAASLDVLLDAYFEPKLRGRLKPHEIELVEQHLRDQRQEALAKPVKKAKPKKPVVLAASPCGKKIPQSFLKNHIRFCKACKAAG